MAEHNVTVENTLQALLSEKKVHNDPRHFDYHESCGYCSGVYRTES